MLKHEKINKLFVIWLTISLFLVFFIIIIGGLTRLTNSGLSITEWELFKGILPPLKSEEWSIYFNLYKNIPQFKLMNPNMGLDEFKIIFYWEYFHRVLARFIGLFFLIPLIFFYFSKNINKTYLRICFLIFFLIVIQGVVGWYMVKSGLINDVTVSHYRLSVHLSMAFIIISCIYWLIQNTRTNSSKIFFNFSYKNLPYLILILFIFFQIILGDFVSGLDAGRVYQTWPLMGSTYFPDDIILNHYVKLFNFDNHSLVQFYHRNLAYLISFYILVLAFYIFLKRKRYLYRPITFVIILLFTQIFLGILTLISGLNIYIASAHQISSVLLVFSTLNLYFFHTK